MLRNKLPGTGTTIFTIMSKMAQDNGAINLAQGFPDFDGPEALREKVSHHMGHGLHGVIDNDSGRILSHLESSVR